MRRVQVLVFSIACLSIILGTTLLVLEIFRSRSLDLAQPFWKDFDDAVEKSSYGSAWDFLEKRLQPALVAGALPHGAVNRLWSLWGKNPDLELLQRTLNRIVPNLDSSSSEHIALLLLEAKLPGEARRYFKPEAFLPDDPYLADEIGRVEDPGRQISSKDFQGFGRYEAGYLLDRGAAAAYLGDLRLARTFFEQVRRLDNADPAILADANIHLLRVLWDLEDDNALDELLASTPFPDADIADSSFVADLSTLGAERIRQAETYRQLVLAGWQPGPAHSENIRLLRDYVPGVLEILTGIEPETQDPYNEERSLLLSPDRRDIRTIVAAILGHAIERQDSRLTRLSLWYLFGLGDDKAFRDVLDSKSTPHGSGTAFYDAVSLSDLDKSYDKLKELTRGMIGIAARLNKVRLLLLSSRIAEASAQLNDALRELSREARGLDKVFAGHGLEKPEPSTPYALLRADALALRSIIERLSGKPDAMQNTLRELHDLDPAHPIFSRAGGIDLSATDIFGPDAEEYYHDTPKE